MTRIVVISDTHNLLDQISIPDGDILIHAGDWTMMGTEKELIKFNADIGRFPHKHKIVTPGNHEIGYPDNEAHNRALISNATVLIDQAIEINGIKFYMSPWQPTFFDWQYNLPRGNELAKVWAKIPDDTNVLATHGPPYMKRDGCSRSDEDDITGDFAYKIEHVGCWDLAHRIQSLKQLRLSCFGHIHHQYGVEVGADGVTYANASSCDKNYDAVNKPLVFDWVDGIVKEVVGESNGH